jgi:hypothetical protein
LATTTRPTGSFVDAVLQRYHVITFNNADVGSSDGLPAPLGTAIRSGLAAALDARPSGPKRRGRPPKWQTNPRSRSWMPPAKRRKPGWLGGCRNSAPADGFERTGSKSETSARNARREEFAYDNPEEVAISRDCAAYFTSLAGLAAVPETPPVVLRRVSEESLNAIEEALRQLEYPNLPKRSSQPDKEGHD